MLGLPPVKHNERTFDQGPGGSSNGYHPTMATWILAGGFAVLAIILGGALLLVLLFTRDGAENGIRLPRFRGRDPRPGEAAVAPTIDD